jgi:hypothetical protein
LIPCGLQIHYYFGALNHRGIDLVQSHHSVNMSKSSQKQKTEANNLISYLLWKDWLEWDVSNCSFHCHIGHQWRNKLKCSSGNLRDTREVKNFAAAPTPLQFSTSTIRNSLCTYLILESNICFYLIFQSNIFNPSTMINDSFLINSPTLPYALFRLLDLFFSEKASIGDFYIPVLLPVHRGVLSVVTLNGRALVPIGEYSISPSFHDGRTHRGPLDSVCCR